MKRNYYLSILKTKSFKKKPFITIIRCFIVLILDIFKIKKKIHIKHNNIKFNFLYFPNLEKKVAGEVYLFTEKKLKI